MTDLCSHQLQYILGLETAFLTTDAANRYVNKAECNLWIPFDSDVTNLCEPLQYHQHRAHSEKKILKQVGSSAESWKQSFTDVRTGTGHVCRQYCRIVFCKSNTSFSTYIYLGYWWDLVKKLACLKNSELTLIWIKQKSLHWTLSFYTAVLS